MRLCRPRSRRSERSGGRPRPYSFPRWLRAVLTDRTPLLRPVAFAHDIEWHEVDRSREAFDASNKRWKRNGYRVARVEFRAWEP